MVRPVRFRGRLIQAKEGRGPQNKEFTRSDIEKMIPMLPGVQVMYNHGDDATIGKRPVGKIQNAYIDHENWLVVSGITDEPNALGEEVFNRIRNEMVDSTLPMLSIHWIANMVNPEEKDLSKQIAIPEDKRVTEISLVEKGYYDGANIMEVQCSGNRLRWKTTGEVYTDDAENGSTTATQKAMAEAPQRHVALAKLLTPEKRAQLDSPDKILDLYEELFPEMLKKVAQFEQKEKRERDAYSAEKAKEVDELWEVSKSHFPEDKHEAGKKFFASIAQNPEQKEQWEGFVRPTLSKLHESTTKLSEFQKMQPIVPPPATPATPQMSMAASLQRGQQQEAKRPSPSNDAWGDVPVAGEFYEFLKQRANERHHRE